MDTSIRPKTPEELNPPKPPTPHHFATPEAWKLHQKQEEESQYEPK